MAEEAEIVESSQNTESEEVTDLERLDNRVHRQFAPQGLEYSAGSLTWLRKLLITGALTCLPFSLLGDGITKTEICFYPESAQRYDDVIREKREVKFNMQGKVQSEKNLLLGNRYCKPRQRHTIPLGYIRKAQRESSNPDYNPYGSLAVAGIASKGVYEFRNLIPENPFKDVATGSGLIFGLATLYICKREVEALNRIRPAYWESMEIERLTASNYINLTSEALQQWAQRMINLYAGLQEAKLREQMWAALSETEKDLIMLYITDADRERFGWVVPPKTTQYQQAQLEPGSPGTYQEMASRALESGEFNVEDSQKEVAELLTRIVKEDGSTALIAAPGSGKSVALNEIIRQVKSIPGAKITVLSVKNDKFCGLAEQGCVFPSSTTELEIIKQQFDDWFKRYQDRAALPEDKRENLTPDILILDDWIALSSQLTFKYPTWDFGSKLVEVLTTGRDFNSKFICSLQSFNLSALGIKDLDAQLRQIFNLLFLGNRYIKQGREKESYGVIEQIITSRFFCPDPNIRQALINTYYQLKAYSRTEMIPVCVAYCGDYFAGIMPKLGGKDKTIEPENASLPSSDTNPVTDIKTLEGMLNTSKLLDEAEKLVLDWVKKRKKDSKPYDAPTAAKNLKAIKTDNPEVSRVNAIRYIFRQLSLKEYGTLTDRDNFEPNEF